MAFSDAEHAAMEQALQLARRGVRGANPLVGAVILALPERSWRPGCTAVPEPRMQRPTPSHPLRPPAPTCAGATMVVTLEPCNHTGRTGPCSQAILRAGIARVVYGAADTNDDAAGRSRTPWPLPGWIPRAVCSPEHPGT